MKLEHFHAANHGSNLSTSWHPSRTKKTIQAPPPKDISFGKRISYHGRSPIFINADWDAGLEYFPRVDADAHPAIPGFAPFSALGGWAVYISREDFSAHHQPVRGIVRRRNSMAPNLGKRQHHRARSQACADVLAGCGRPLPFKTVSSWSETLALPTRHQGTLASI